MRALRGETQGLLEDSRTLTAGRADWGFNIPYPIPGGGDSDGAVRPSGQCRRSSGDKGFQWKFHCDLCGSGFDTTFIPSKSATSSRRLGFLSSGLSAMGTAVSGSGGGSGIYAASQGAGAASQFKGMSAAWHTEHDNAFQQAVNEAKVHFQRCPKCKKYVCPDDWNNEAGLCTTDAPSLTTETQATKAQVRVEQMQESVKGQKLYDGDSSDRATICPTCGKPAGAG